MLVKPQFEAGRARIGKGGIVRDPDVHRAVLREVRDGLVSHGLVVTGVIASPRRGADGNVEFLFHLTKAGTPISDDELRCRGRGRRRPVRPRHPRGADHERTAGGITDGAAADGRARPAR